MRTEFLRALGGLLAAPFRTIGYLATSGSERARVKADLSTRAELTPAEPGVAFPREPLRVFVSCAEPSGETHAVSLVRALRALAEEHGAPPPSISGLGGPRLADEGVELVGDPVSRAAMGFDGILRQVPWYMDLLEDCARAFRTGELDVCVPVDSPALHVPLGRMARRYGLPVAHFITPQYWGWAPWRVAGYRRAVDRALTILPFEPSWFARHRVPSAHVGHPLLDALEGVPRGDGSGDALALLPGSREGVVKRNLPWMLDVLAARRDDLGGREVLLPHDRPELAPLLDELIAASDARDLVRTTGDLHGTLARSRAAFSVSGTILIDLLHHRLPAVVLYRLGKPREVWAYRHLLSTPWFSSVNLLADEEVLPEFCFEGAGPAREVGDALVRALDDEPWRAGCAEGLERAARRLGGPGAARRAAARVLETARREAP